ncbi:MAG: toll/interleukin-1 receptor domain-containing protein, partial [Pseudomonadota bacterium]
MADVFISYSSEDRERVRPLAEALEQRGLSVWWDRAQAAGDEYAWTIQKALDEARVVVVVWS